MWLSCTVPRHIGTVCSRLFQRLSAYLCARNMSLNATRKFWTLAIKELAALHLLLYFNLLLTYFQLTFNISTYFQLTFKLLSTCFQLT